MTGASKARQKGLSVATALFVVTVMAFLAVMINELVSDNAQGAAEELNLVRAFYAAESGAQIGMSVLFPPSGAGASCAGLGLTFAVVGLDQCQASVSCGSVAIDVDGDMNDETFYTVTSTGTCGSVSRTIQVRAQ